MWLERGTNSAIVSRSFGDIPRRYALLCFIKARAERDVAVVADSAVLEALVNGCRGAKDRLALEHNRVHEFSVRFEDDLVEDDRPENW